MTWRAISTRPYPKARKTTPPLTKATPLQATPPSNTPMGIPPKAPQATPPMGVAPTDRCRR